MNLDADISPFTKINSEWIIDLHVKHKMIKLLEDNTEKVMDDVEYGDDILDINQRHDLWKK